MVFDLLKALEYLLDASYPLIKQNFELPLVVTTAKLNDRWMDINCKKNLDSVSVVSNSETQ